MTETGQGAPIDPLLKRYINASNVKLAHPLSGQPDQSLLTSRSYVSTRALIWVAFSSYLAYVLLSKFDDVVEVYPEISFASYVWGYITHEGTLLSIIISLTILLVFIRSLKRLTWDNWKITFALGLGAFVLASLPMDVFFGEYENAVTAGLVSMLVVSVYLLTSVATVRISGGLLPIVVPTALFAAFWGVAAIGNEFGMTGDGSLYWFILGYVPVVMYALPAVLMGSVLYAFVRWFWKRKGWQSVRVPVALRLLMTGAIALVLSIGFRSMTSEETFFLIPLPGLLLGLLSIVLTDQLARKWNVDLPSVWVSYISPSGRWLLLTIFLAMLMALFLPDYSVHGDNFMNSYMLGAIIFPW